jgi:hypothetical protein
MHGTHPRAREHRGRGEEDGEDTPREEVESRSRSSCRRLPDGEAFLLTRAARLVTRRRRSAGEAGAPPRQITGGRGD